MEYKVLYRKYRPQNFDALVGQEWTSKMLRNAIKNEKISHAYIFTGPRGTGKTSSARIFAKAINCEHPIDGNPCGTCEKCKNFENNPDIIEIDAASNNGVDEIRELINNIRLAPTTSKYKVYIIDEFHMLSTSAFNALLLTLEEPPSNIVFILATTDIQSVPITIISRCQRFDFRPITYEILVNHLKDISNKENIKISASAIEEIASLANGGLRDALGMLDQISSQVDDIDIDDVVNLFGTISKEKIQSLIATLEDNNVSEMLKILNDFRNSSVNYNVLIKKIIDNLKELAIKIRVNEYKGNLTFDLIYNLIWELNSCLGNKNSLTTLDLLEVILLKYNYFPGNKNEKKNEVKEENKETTKDDTKKEVEKIKVNELPKEIKSEERKVSTDFIKIRVNNCFVNAKKSYLTDLLAKWDDFVIYEANANKSLMTYVVDTIPVTASNEYAIISNKVDYTNDLINQNIESLEKDLAMFYGKPYKLVAITESDWNHIKEEYINNLKKGYKYEMMDENMMEEQEARNVTDLEKLAEEIFGTNNYEVK